MNRKGIVICSLLAVCLVASGAMAQVVMRHGGGGEGENDIVLVHELGIVVGFLPDSEDARVIVLLPDADPALELKKDDLVLMINGERIRDLATLRQAYESAPMGETVKVGFRRGDRRFLRSFEKKEAEEGRQVRMVMGGPGQDFSDMQPMPEFGVVLGEKDGKISVAMELPMGEPALKKDDQVKSINGTEIDSLAALREVYEPLAVGADVALVVVRAGEEVSASRAKTEFDGMLKVRRGP